MIKFLDLNAQYLSIKREIDNAIQNVISKSSFIGGEYLKKFENNFSKYVNTEFCIGVANGTDAIEIAIESLNLPIGSEILVPSLSFISTSEAVSRQGHKPKFVKFDENNFTISTSDIENKQALIQGQLLLFIYMANPVIWIKLIKLQRNSIFML